MENAAPCPLLGYMLSTTRSMALAILQQVSQPLDMSHRQDRHVISYCTVTVRTVLSCCPVMYAIVLCCHDLHGSVLQVC